jgi:hypothetical protein
MRVRYWGVHYDTGVHFSQNFFSRERFDHDLVRYEIHAIKHELHANAVRIIGADIDRLRFATIEAIAQGLTVFFSPWFIDRDHQDTLTLLTRAAKVAEELRNQGGNIVFVVGCEVSLFAPGFIPGANVYERVSWVLSQDNPGSALSPLVLGGPVSAALRSWVAAVRPAFAGQVTYAAGTWEGVDWSMFDVIGLDHYRSDQSREEYAATLRDAASHGKPVAVTEFGCCTYRGADKLGGLGWLALDGLANNEPRWTAGTVPERSEETQARYITDQLDIMLAEGVAAAFIFTFSNAHLLHDRTAPDRDFDMAGYSLTKQVVPQTERFRELPPWDRKQSFYAVARYFARLQAAEKSAAQRPLRTPSL